MYKSAVLHARMEPHLKHQAEAILDKIGLSTADAVSLFFRQIVVNKGLPFELRVPNKETRRAIRDTLAGKNLRRFATMEDLRRAMEGKTPQKRKRHAS